MKKMSDIDRRLELAKDEIYKEKLIKYIKE